MYGSGWLREGEGWLGSDSFVVNLKKSHNKAGTWKSSLPAGSSGFQMLGWLAGWLAGCLASWLVGCLNGWLDDWLSVFLPGWLAGWWVVCLSGWLSGWLVSLLLPFCTALSLVPSEHLKHHPSL